MSRTPAHPERELRKQDEPAPGGNPFDAKALTWDENPARRALLAALAGAIGGMVDLRPDWRMLEYGCGTAGLSVHLAGRVREIVAVDASAGMIEQARTKLRNAGLTTIVPRLGDWTREPPPADAFDLIVMAMALHHVADTIRLLRVFAGLLKPGATLVLADLAAEDGSFHRDMTVPHNGFVPAALARDLNTLGFSDCRWQVAHTLRRENRGYDVFVLAAVRSPPGAGHGS